MYRNKARFLENPSRMIGKKIEEYVGTHKLTKITALRARNVFFAIFSNDNRNIPIFSRVSINGLIYLCFASTNDNNTYHKSERISEEKFIQFINALAEIPLITNSAKTAEFNPLDVFEYLIKMMLIVHPNLVTLVRDFGIKIASEKLEHLALFISNACLVENSEYSWEQGVHEIGNLLYNEFQTEQERYLPKTGLFPEGRFSPKFMDFLETCKQIEMPKKADNQFLQSILNIDKSYPNRDQKKFDRVMQSREGSASRSRTPSPPPSQSQRTASDPTVILSALPDEQIARHVFKKLKTIGIVIKSDELEAYSPTVLCAFHAVLPLFNEDNLLTQNNVKSMLRMFSAAPDPQIRCRCLIILSQCGLLLPGNLETNIVKLEFMNRENPSKFQEIYAEAWVQTEANSKWLQQTMSAIIPEADMSLNTNVDWRSRFFESHSDSIKNQS